MNIVIEHTILERKQVAETMLGLEQFLKDMNVKGVTFETRRKNLR